MGINVNIEKGNGTVEKSALKLRNFGQDEPLPVASADTLGGVKVGEGLSITDAGVLSASGGNFIVNVTKTGSTWNSSATPSEIIAAINNGTPVFIYVNKSTYGISQATIFKAGNDGDGGLSVDCVVVSVDYSSGYVLKLSYYFIINNDGSVSMVAEN